MNAAPLFGRRLKHLVVRQDARHVDKDIHRSELVGNARISGLDRLLAGHIDRQTYALGWQSRRHLLALALIQVDDSNAASLHREIPSNCTPDRPSRASHQCYFPPESAFVQGFDAAQQTSSSRHIASAAQPALIAK
eukprot:CAMPEP_0195591670 /NCGR_PEP_ID=MMETSP0814-20130614/34763_1 /TAXON_ID=97485 /ORGANISM="Prymnesium parvum, Strain Texoma1" /LENGTH=135 /DNA_ID=CAMNT_0040730715 /DNA_START=571 /DNA_END=976 /DNA_ORIENTATION=-